MSDDAMYGFDEVVEAREGVCPEGKNPVTAQQAEFTTSSSGNPMIVVRFIVDSGENAGFEIVERFAWDGPTSFGIRKLKSFCKACSYTWGRRDNMELFAKQFEGLRADALVSHKFSAKEKGGYKNMKKEEFDAYEGEGEKRMSAQITSFSPATGSPDIVFGSSAGKTQEQDISALNVDEMF